jgi:hypothetical protein
MGNNWSEACAKQFSRSTSQQKQANYGSGIFAVSPALRFCLCGPCSLQVVTFGCAAVFSGIWFALWIRMEIQKRREAVWRNLGWYSGLVLLGCVAGSVCWFAFMMAIEYQFQANAPGVTARQNNAFIATSLRWFIVWDFFYPVEVLCLVLCRIMLLRRLSAHALHGNSSQNAPPRSRDDNVRAWHCITDLAPEKLQRVIASIELIAVLCCVAGVLAMYVAIAFSLESANMFDQAATCDAQGCNDQLAESALNKLLQAITALSAQNVLEAVVLVMICFAYTIFVPVSVAMFSRAELRLSEALDCFANNQDNEQVMIPVEYAPVEADGAVGKIAMNCGDAKALLRKKRESVLARRQRFVTACGIVLIAFMARASAALMSAFVFFNYSENKQCGACEPCQNDAFLIRKWLDYTPEFQRVIVTLSSPLPLVLSLWLMMTKKERRALLFLQDPGVDLTGTREMTSLQRVSLINLL